MDPLLDILVNSSSSSSSSTSSSSSDSEREREDKVFSTCSSFEGRRSKIRNFSEGVIPQMDDVEFKSHFRMLPSTFEFILQQIQLENLSGTGRRSIPAKKQLQVVIWLLAAPDSFRSVSLKFGLAKSTLWETFEKGVTAIAGLSPQFIKFPSSEMYADIAAQFFKKASFPGVVGCIDGCHINIKAPKVHPESYINRKGQHSILLQGVVDHRYTFLNCYAGEVGSVHDARVFRRSKFPDMIRDLHPYHILGDAAYPLLRPLTTPFRDNGRLTAQQRRYNVAFSRTRSTVERAFALLKGRFRRLKYIEMSRTDLIPTVIMACCVLHNVCIMKEDEWEEAEVVTSQSSLQNVSRTQDIEDQEDRAAAAKRMSIALVF